MVREKSSVMKYVDGMYTIFQNQNRSWSCTALRNLREKIGCYPQGAFVYSEFDCTVCHRVYKNGF